MDNSKIAIVLIVDRSGSMSRIERATEDALKEFVNQQKSVEGDFTVDTVFFDSQYEERAVMVNPREVELDLSIRPRGMTAMFDAIGRKINDFAGHIETLGDDKPENVLFVIATDGAENASREYDQKTVATLIETKQEAGWNFTFIGANQDAIATARGLNISENNAITFKANDLGVEAVIGAMSAYTSSIRLGEEAAYTNADRMAAVGDNDDQS